MISVPPPVWGPMFWMTIHLVALGYPSSPTYTDKRSAKNFFEALANLIPCPICREHYKGHLEKHPISPNLDTNKDLFDWTVKLHNEVNKSLGKPEWTREEALDYIKELGARKRSPIYTSRDIADRNLRSALEGAVYGGIAVATVMGVYMWMRGSDSK
jgi:hypothetical protein